VIDRQRRRRARDARRRKLIEIWAEILKLQRHQFVSAASSARDAPFFNHDVDRAHPAGVHGAAPPTCFDNPTVRGLSSSSGDRRAIVPIHASERDHYPLSSVGRLFAIHQMVGQRSVQHATVFAVEGRSHDG
jgi:hypothetical protein